MTNPTPHRYYRAGQAAARDPDVLSAATRQIIRSETAGAQPMLSLRHVAHLAGAPYLYLRRIVQRGIDPYVDLPQRKRSGGVRAIAAPEPLLMDVQRMILRKSLRNLQLHTASWAYQENRSIIGCAQQHIGARWMIKFDLHDFFHFIDEARVYKVFESRGYSPLVSFELARLTTRNQSARAVSPEASPYSGIPSYNVTGRGHLPQGSPTSGALANAVAAPLDGALSGLAAGAGFVYTRYSDDLVMSTSQPFDRSLARELIGTVSTLVTRHGFRLHCKKTRVIAPGARRVVLGLLVHENEVRLTPEYRRTVEVHIRGVKQHGLAAHARHRRFRSVLSFVSHVDGRLAFAVGVEPGWAAAARGSWTDALRQSGFPF